MCMNVYIICTVSWVVAELRDKGVTHCINKINMLYENEYTIREVKCELEW